MSTPPFRATTIKLYTPATIKGSPLASRMLLYSVASPTHSMNFAPWPRPLTSAIGNERMRTVPVLRSPLGLHRLRPPLIRPQRVRVLTQNLRPGPPRLAPPLPRPRNPTFRMSWAQTANSCLKRRNDARRTTCASFAPRKITSPTSARPGKRPQKPAPPRWRQSRMMKGISRDPPPKLSLRIPQTKNYVR